MNSILNNKALFIKSAMAYAAIYMVIVGSALLNPRSIQSSE